MAIPQLRLGVLAVLAVGVTLLLPALALAWGPLLDPSRLHGAGVRSATTATSPCTSLTTAPALVALIAQKYPNSTLEPTEAIANASVVGIWNEVCGSTLFQSAYSTEANVTFGTTISVEDKNVSANGWITGSLFVQFTQSWEAGCPSEAGQYAAGYPCEFTQSWIGNLTTAAYSGPILTTVSYRFALCTTLTTNQSVEGMVGGFYPDSSLQPNETDAEQAAAIIWGNVCSSPAFFMAYHANANVSLATGARVPTSNESGRFVTGPGLVIQFQLIWTAGCPGGPPKYPTGYPCEFAESWTGNLSSATFAGPTTTARSDAGLGGPPPSPTTGNPQSNTSSLFKGPIIPVGVIGSAALVVSGILVIVYRRRHQRPPRPPPPASPVNPSGQQLSPPPSAAN